MIARTGLWLCACLFYRVSAWTPQPAADGWNRRIPHISTIVEATTSGAVSTDEGVPPLDPDCEKTRIRKLQGKLLKNMRRVCRDYDMIEPDDHIMVCVSGGKDSATLLYLLLHLQRQWSVTCPFRITAVHVDQKQPGYDGTALVRWLRDDLQVPYRIIEEDTYSIVLDKTAPTKSFCTVCSRLRRGILYTAAQSMDCNKLMLGHHADDAMETLLLNMIHSGSMKAMPARYTSSRGSLSVMRPLIACMGEHIAEYALLQRFPILPCNLCSNQANLQRPQIKLLLQTLTALNPSGKRNVLNSMMNVEASHLLDQGLREACGMDPVTGEDGTGDNHGCDDEEAGLR